MEFLVIMLIVIAGILIGMFFNEIFNKIDIRNDLRNTLKHVNDYIISNAQFVVKNDNSVGPAYHLAGKCEKCNDMVQYLDFKVSMHRFSLCKKCLHKLDKYLLTSIIFYAEYNSYRQFPCNKKQISIPDVRMYQDLQYRLICEIEKWMEIK